MNRLGVTFWRLWRSASLSSLANGSFKVALPLAAHSLTSSPALIAGVVFTTTLPWLLFALPAGAFVDRCDRRTVMLAANIARSSALVAFGVLSIAGTRSIAALFLLAFVVGIAETLYDTAASAMIPTIVPGALRGRANAWQQVGDLVANQLLGPAMGGLLIGVGIGLTFSTSAALWLLATGGLLLVRGAFRPTAAPTVSLRRAVGDGLRLLWWSRILRSVTLCVGITNFAGSAAAAVLVVYAVGPGSALGLTNAEYGLLLVASAGGSVVGAACVNRVRARFGLRVALGTNVVTQAIQITIPLVTHSTWAVVGGFVLGGVGLAIWNVSSVSVRQEVAPSDMLGRITGSARLVSWGALSLGALCGGVLAEVTSVRLVFVCAGLMTLTGLVAAPAWSQANLDRDRTGPRGQVSADMAVHCFQDSAQS